MTIPSNPLSYQSAPIRARVSAAALSSMVLGLFSLATSIFGLGALGACVAIPLALFALRKIRRDPASLGGKGFAWIGLVTGLVGLFASIPFVYAIMMASHHRELARRTACAANLNGIAIAMKVYAGDNGGNFPATWAGPVTTPSFNWGGTAGPTMEDAARAIHERSAGSPPACIWILALDGSLNPAALKCPSDPFASGDYGAPLGSRLDNWSIAPNRPDNFSYSLNLPWADSAGAPGTRGGTLGPWWKSTANARQPLMADMVQNSSTPAGSAAKPSEYNSLSHAGAGQNISFADGRVEWSATTLVNGTDDIRFYTAGPRSGSAINAYPNYPLRTVPPFDTFMTPRRDTAGRTD